MATNHYVDSNTGDNLDTGATQALAWATLEHAVEAGALAADYDVWVRRTHVEFASNPTSDILPAYSGTPKQPIRVIVWPRAAIPNTTITGADWTNGSELVDNVAGITPTRTRHMGRFATAPDGKLYLLTAILIEFTVDGMAGGAEFTVGSKITNTTQTKHGKIWAFTDNLDNTGTLQVVIDPASARVNNDNVIDADGGDAELSANATNVGFLIDREYAGSTVTGVDGKFQIEKDEDFDTRPADVDGWDADADDLVCIDWKDQAFQLNFNIGSKWWTFKNLEMRDSGDLGVIFLYKSGIVGFQGCLFYTDQNKTLIRLTTRQTSSFRRCIFEGSGAGAAQYGVRVEGSSLAIYDTAIYGMGNYGFWAQQPAIYLENVNVGIEVANGDADFFAYTFAKIHGRDVKLGGTNGYFDFDTCQGLRASFENYGKVLGAHKEFNSQGEITKLLADGAGDAPNQRTGGAANVAEILYNLSNTTNNLPEPIQDWTPEIYNEPIEADTTSQDYRIYVQSMADLTAIQLWLECEYVSGYDDAGEYVFTIVKSTDTITTRADADDWTQYIEVTGIQPAVASKVRLKVKCAHSHAANKVFIDPKR